MEIIEKVKELALPVIESFDCRLFDVTFKKEGKDYYLRLLVEKKTGNIDLDLIVKISEQLSPLLDENDFISVNYVLDISSVGAERPISLDELPEFVGRYVHLHLSNPYKGANDLEGDLLEVNDEEAILSFKDKTRTIKVNLKLSTIDRARLAIKF